MTAFFDSLLGSKVLLRPFVVTDITTEYIAWLNDPQVVKYSNQRFICHTEDTCRRYFDSFTNTQNLFLSVHTKADGRAVGTMVAYVFPYHKRVDMSIMIGNHSIWGGGIGQDAWNTLLNWFIEQQRIRKVTAGTMRCNHPMIKLMERSGMNLEATRQKQELLNEIPQDILLYGKFCGY